MKYHIGDKIILKTWEQMWKEFGTYGHAALNTEMEAFYKDNRIDTVIEVHPQFAGSSIYRLQNGGWWHYNDDMIAGYALKDVDVGVDVPSVIRFKVNGVKFKFIKLPNGLYMGETPVTQRQWTSVMENNPSYFTGKKRPVECVSWFDAQEYINKLNNMPINKVPGLFRLPTESEWEYACRAGTTTEYNVGDILIDADANFNSKSTSEVKAYLPNSWGLYDMHGNVWEWCDSWFDEDKQYRVLRGGSWINNARYCRSAYRGSFESSYRFDFYGFRLVLVLKKGNGNA